MTTTTKILLATSLICLVTSISQVWFGLFLPLGVILFGLFMISRVLGKEMALLDEEQQSRLEKAERRQAAARTPAPTQTEPHGEMAFAAKH